jgi:hypothetical protein
MPSAIDPRDPHAGQPVLTAGPPPADARLAMILVMAVAHPLTTSWD